MLCLFPRKYQNSSVQQYSILTNRFNCWNAVSPAGVQLNSLLKLSNNLDRELTSAIFWWKFCRLCKAPIRDTNCFLDLGCFRALTAWVYLSGVVPSLPILKANHPNSLFANSHFLNFRATFLHPVFDELSRLVHCILFLSLLIRWVSHL